MKAVFILIFFFSNFLGQFINAQKLSGELENFTKQYSEGDYTADEF
jgi:hypothetical protein